MKPLEPIVIRERSDRPGQWQVWIRPLTGLPVWICDEWTRKSLDLAPPEFLAVNPWPRTKKAAYRVALALVEWFRQDMPVPIDAAGPLVKEYVALFKDVSTSPRARRLEAAGRPYSAATAANYRDRIEHHVETDETFCALHMSLVTRQDLEAYFSRLSRKLGGPCRTLQDVWAILHMIFRQYAMDNPGAPDPFTGMSKPSYQEEIRGALSEAELQAIFAAPFPTPIERAICALAFWAGLRRAEVFALHWSDVDFEGKRITVQHAYKRFGDGLKVRTEGGTKGGKARTVPAVDYVLEALKALPRVDEYVISFPGGRRPGGIRDRGMRPGEYDWRNAMRGAFERAGIDMASRKVTPHSSRHSIASVLLSRGVPKEYIRQILGHFDERTTDGYLHMAAEEIGKMTERLDKIRGDACQG
jgi:integrase